MRDTVTATGASFVSGPIECNPLDFIVDLLKKNPGATLNDLFPRFRELLSDGADGYQRAVDYYFFVNMHRVLTDKRPTNQHGRSAPNRERIEASEAAIRQVVDVLKEQIVVLELTMPNGKSMKDCTGAEMARFGNRFQKIAERVGKAKTVGAVLSEDQVKAIMK